MCRIRISGVVLLVMLLSLSLNAQTEDDMFGFAPIAVLEWPCGADGFDLTCVRDEEGTLTVYGVGRMRDYVPPMGGPLIAASADVSPAPWGGTAKIVIGNGVTYIGRFAFYVLNVQQPLTSVNVGCWTESPEICS